MGKLRFVSHSPPSLPKKKPSNDNPYHSNDDQDMKFLNISVKLR